MDDLITTCVLALGLVMSLAVPALCFAAAVLGGLPLGIAAGVALVVGVTGAILVQASFEAI